MTFPLANKQDSSKFKEQAAEDPTIAAPMEGGYVITRPRYTRRPRYNFTTGFTDLSETEKNTFQNFYNAQRGGAASFSYTHPTSGVVYTVRFKKDSMPNFDYAGFGSTYRWNIDNIVLEEV